MRGNFPRARTAGKGALGPAGGLTWLRRAGQSPPQFSHRHGGREDSPRVRRGRAGAVGRGRERRARRSGGAEPSLSIAPHRRAALPAPPPPPPPARCSPRQLLGSARPLHRRCPSPSRCRCPGPSRPWAPPSYKRGTRWALWCGRGACWEL